MLRIAVIIAGVLAAAGSARAEDHEVSQRNRTFKPKSLAVTVGDTVIFRNDDSTPHHIRADRGPVKFSSRLLPRGADYEVSFDREGRWEVGCRIHPRMGMTVEVRRETAAREERDDAPPPAP